MQKERKFKNWKELRKEFLQHALSYNESAWNSMGRPVVCGHGLEMFAVWTEYGLNPRFSSYAVHSLVDYLYLNGVKVVSRNPERLIPRWLERLLYKNYDYLGDFEVSKVVNDHYKVVIHFRYRSLVLDTRQEPKSLLEDVEWVKF